MAFVEYRLEKKSPFSPYLFISIMFHLGILLASKIIIWHSPTNPENYQFAVKLIDIAEQPKTAISSPPKSTRPIRTRKLKKSIKKAFIPKQDPLKQFHPPLTLDKRKPVTLPTVLEKPISPRFKHEVHTPKNFLTKGTEDKLHAPQITHKEVLLINPKDILTGVKKTGEIATRSHLSPISKSAQGKEISGLIERNRGRFGFKQPAKSLAIGGSLKKIESPLTGSKYIPLDSKDPNLAPYLAYIKERILQFWRYPEEAEPGLEGKIDLAFIVERDGNVSEIKIVNFSRYKILDKAVLDTIGRAVPFKPIPLEIQEKRLPLIGTFLYNKPTYHPDQPKN